MMSLFDAYSRQVAGLIEGGADLLLFETVFDTLNLKVTFDAAGRMMESMGRDLPIMISATVSDRSGRTLSGQTLAAFVTSVADYPHVVSMGLNCSFGPSDIIPYVKELASLTPHFIARIPMPGCRMPWVSMTRPPKSLPPAWSVCSQPVCST